MASTFFAISLSMAFNSAFSLLSYSFFISAIAYGVICSLWYLFTSVLAFGMTETPADSMRSSSCLHFSIASFSFSLRSFSLAAADTLTLVSSSAALFFYCSMSCLSFSTSSCLTKRSFCSFSIVCFCLSITSFELEISIVSSLFLTNLSSRVFA